MPGEAREIKGRRGWGGEGLEGHWEALTADWQGLPLGTFEEERVIVCLFLGGSPYMACGILVPHLGSESPKS